MSNVHEMLEIAGSFENAEEMAKNFIKEKGPEFLLDLGLLYSWRGKIDESWECIRQASEAFPDDDRVAYNRGWHLLLQGEFYKGYELMNRARNAGIWSKNIISNQPKWQGENVKNKHVLFYAEAGYGDEIVYMRFAKEIAKLGAHVTAIATSGLVPLFARIPELSCVVARKPTLGDESGNTSIAQGIYHDYWITSLASPIPLKTEWSDIHGEPYMTPHPGYVQKLSKYMQTDKLKVGIRWLGQDGPDYANRIFPRDQFFEAVTQDHVQLFSLQKDHSEDGLSNHIIDLEVLLDTWEDTAGAIANLDLVISSCTSIAHLAAAMGKPTWIIVPVMMYCTWAHPGNSTPWYDSATLFRQEVYDEWHQPFNRIKENLKTFERTSNLNIFYNPEFFEVNNMKEAKKVIVSTDRWESETPYVVEQVGEFLEPSEDDLILDYGCGAGRIAKGLIDKYNCNVLGVDISSSMRNLAVEYVNSPKFSTCSTEKFIEKILEGFRVDHAIAIWTLQHCLDVQDIIENIELSLKRDGLIYILNDVNLLIPSKLGGWMVAGIDIYKFLKKEFVEIDMYKLSSDIAPEEIANRSYISKWRKRNLNEN